MMPIPNTTASNTTTRTTGIHIGANTHHHDHAIFPNTFMSTNKIVNTVLVGNEAPAAPTAAVFVLSDIKICCPRRSSYAGCNQRRSTRTGYTAGSVRALTLSGDAR